MNWTSWRDEFPILGHTTYLNSCSLGALSRRAEQRLRDFRNEWHTHGASAWYETWMGRLAELRGRVSGMLGAPDGTVALSPSVSAALSVIASAIDYAGPGGGASTGAGGAGRRNRVVVSDLDFPTLGYQWMARNGVEVVRVPSDDGATIDLRRWADAVNDRTAVLATSHVFFTTGAIQDIGALAGIARDAGALCLIDGYQATGQIPTDVVAADVDVYITGPLKWLMGGPGLAYTYVRESLIDDLRPTTAGWFGAADQFDFDITRYEPKPDARRFEMGTPALHTVHTALGGQEIVDEIGVAAIRERNRSLTERLIERADAEGFAMNLAPDADARSAIVMIEHEDPHAAVDALARAGIIVDARPGYVRVSPHFYNTGDEIDRVVAELAASGGD
ncbi:MAG: aminotransferase class V-fold PLP-dependent enzyme [Candidatus Longimicrobiales bacterium M2_2A_002]